ncbi:MAG: hypothetical protein WBC93_00830 [Sulfitobacter sp.]
MRVILGFLLCLISGAVSAQSWEAKLSDNGGYAYGYAVYPGLKMAFACVARSVQNRPLMDVFAHEDQPTKPYHMRIELNPPLIPNVSALDGVILYANDTGFRLPRVMNDEFFGYASVELPMSDSLFSGLNSARRVVLAVDGSTAWELPTNGLGDAIKKAREYCTATWVATGHPVPRILNPFPSDGELSNVPESSTFGTGWTTDRLRQALDADIARACPKGIERIDNDTIYQGDIDGDQVDDLMVYYRGVYCNGASFADKQPYCGASMCSFSVYLSQLFPSKQTAEEYLGFGAAMVPNGQGGVDISYGLPLNACANANDCSETIRWDGSKLAVVPK